MVAEAGGKWNIPRSELTQDIKLGQGNFGIVYKGNYKFQKILFPWWIFLIGKFVHIISHLLGTWQKKVPVAIKQLRDDRMDDSGGYEKAKEEFLKEAKIFQLVNHPNLVQVIFQVS